MQTAIFNTAHFIKLTFHGETHTLPSRVIASWEGWPSEGARTVRRRLTQVDDREAMAREAADMLCAWLSTPPGDGKQLTFSPVSITLAGMGNTAWACLVKTTHARDI